MHTASTRWIVPLSLVVVLLAPALSQGLPMVLGNAVENPGFEEGLAGWRLRGSLIAVVPDGNGGIALRTTHGGTGNWVYQPIDDLVAQVMVYQVRAKVTGSPEVPGVQVNGAISNWNPAGGCLAGGCRFMAGFSLGQDEVRAYVLNGAPTSFPAPSTDEWHTYTLVFVPALSVGVFFIDDVPMGQLTGNQNLVELADYVYAGDGAHARGAAPTVMWDDFYYGPAS